MKLENIKHEIQLPSVLMHYTEYSPLYPFYITQHPFGFKIFSLAESYQITYSLNTQIHNSYLTLPSIILLPKTRAQIVFTHIIYSHLLLFSFYLYILVQFSKDNIMHSFINKYYILNIKRRNMVDYQNCTP